jgi:hypothetical protein
VSDNHDELKEPRPKYKRTCTGVCEGCNPILGGCEDEPEDDFLREDESE